MIKVSKETGFSSCNVCGRYNQEPNFDPGTKTKLCGDVYSYLLTCVEIRLCDECAKELRDLLNKQLRRKKNEN